MRECPAMDLGLDGRACIVTGASGGIGRAAGVALAGEGAAVLLTARREEPLEEAAEACREAGGQAEIIALDVTADEAGDRLLETCLERFGRIDVLVNNAGTSFARRLDELTDED